MKKKYDKDEALAKIKAKIGRFYESIGRQEVEDTEEAKQELIDSIDEILNNTDISSKHMIIEKLSEDPEVNKEFVNEWREK